MVLVSALLGTVFVASIGVGYTASRPLNDTGGAVLAKGNTVAYVNGESGRVEAEARALASGETDLETVTLHDGRVAVVDNKAGQVWIVDTAMMTPQGAPIDRGSEQAGADVGDGLAVVAGPQHSYLVDSTAGTVEAIDPAGAPRTPVQVPGGATNTAVPDRADGVWVLTAEGMVVHVRNGQAAPPVDSGGRVEHLTVADGRPIAITDSGELLDISADPVRRVAGERVTHGPNVVVGSPEGAGRWILVVDRRARELIAVDPRTGTRRVIPGLSAGPNSNLGAPVIVGDTVYVPDHAQHLLYVRNVATGEATADIEVPGRSSRISLEVHGEQVWANDQHDRRAVVIGPDGHWTVVDKGTGEGLTDTTAPQDPDVTEPAESRPEPVTVPGPVAAAPLPVPAGPAEPVGPVEGAAPAPEQVPVPDIRPGTDKDDACQRIEEAGLLCATVAAGDDGPSNEVIGTDPPGGSLLPPGYRVTVRHYGPRTVPEVVGHFTADACREIKAAGLHCASEPTPDVAASPAELDVVSAQDPAGGADVSTDSPVSVRYANRAVLADYRNRPAAQACADVEATYRRVDCTVTEGQTEQQTGQAAGTGYTQSPAPGAVITMGQSVTITAVKGSPQVPDVQGMSQAEACQTLASAGYGCDARADAIARHAVVTTQDTAPGTPMDSGNVVIHYAPHEPVAFRLYQSNTGEPVFLVRMDGNPDQNYSTPYGGILGYGYAQQWEQPGSWMIWDHYCTSNKETCLGWSTNHYQSRSNQRFHDNWQGPQESAKFIAPAGPEQCSAGQVPMYRFANFKGRDRDYIVGSSAPAKYGDYQEFLGCLWSP